MPTPDVLDPKREVYLPPKPDVPELTPRQLRELEKSAVREAIALVCTDGAAKLGDWMEKIEANDGPKVAFDCFIKLLEFAQPKLQRVTVEDPDGNAPQMPVINLHFPTPAPPVIVDVTAHPEPEAPHGDA